MTRDDPRHGTNAGFLAHRRADQSPCEPCRKARAKHNKRTVVRLASGDRRRVPLGADAWRIIHTTTRTELSRASGVFPNMLSRYHSRGPDTIVLKSTRDRILAARPQSSPVGLQRRVRALAAIGYSATDISRRAGYSHPDALMTLRRGPGVPAFIRADNAAAICRVYDELSMTPAPAGRTATRQIREARAKGWAPPLAWDDIDDPDETPNLGAARDDDIDPVAVEFAIDGADVRLTRAERVEVARRMAEQGASDRQIAAVLGVSASGVQRLRARHGIPARQETAA